MKTALFSESKSGRTITVNRVANYSVIHWRPGESELNVPADENARSGSMLAD